MHRVFIFYNATIFTYRQLCNWTSCSRSTLVSSRLTHRRLRRRQARKTQFTNCAFLLHSKFDGEKRSCNEMYQQPPKKEEEESEKIAISIIKSNFDFVWNSRCCRCQMSITMKIFKECTFESAAKHFHDTLTHIYVTRLASSAARISEFQCRKLSVIRVKWNHAWTENGEMFLVRGLFRPNRASRMNKAEKIALIGHRYVLIRISRALEPASNFRVFTSPFRVVSPPVRCEVSFCGATIVHSNR